MHKESDLYASKPKGLEAQLYWWTPRTQFVGCRRAMVANQVGSTTLTDHGGPLANHSLHLVDHGSHLVDHSGYLANYNNHLANNGNHLDDHNLHLANHSLHLADLVAPSILPHI